MSLFILIAILFNSLIIYLEICGPMMSYGICPPIIPDMVESEREVAELIRITGKMEELLRP